MDAIRTDGLTKYYGKTRGVEHIDLTVRQGDFFGFIGPNGAGKSTTIRTLLGLIRPSGGTAEILGMDIVKEHKKFLSCVGYLPSEAAFYSGMRVRDVLKLSADLRKKIAGKRQRSCVSVYSWTRPGRWTSYPSATERRQPSYAPYSMNPIY